MNTFCLLLPFPCRTQENNAETQGGANDTPVANEATTVQENDVEDKLDGVPDAPAEEEVTTGKTEVGGEIEGRTKQTVEHSDGQDVSDPADSSAQVRLVSRVQNTCLLRFRCCLEVRNSVAALLTSSIRSGRSKCNLHRSAQGE